MAIVIGCGPIGLAVICMLKAQGVRTIVASDFSAGRRELAVRCGATWSSTRRWRRPTMPPPSAGTSRHPRSAELALDTIERLRRLPLDWRHLWRATEALGIKPKHRSSSSAWGCPA